MPQSWDMGQNIFNSPPKEGMLEGFLLNRKKSNGFGQGLNPRTRVPEASMGL
jgi:hypothetical protein